MRRLLLDTCAFFWWHGGSALLGSDAHAAIASGHYDIYVSAVSAWEMITKFHSGKEPSFGPIAARFEAIIAAQGFRELPISVAHAACAAALPMHHKDPFDRMLIAQALLDNMEIATSDRIFDAYGIARIW